jgi:hypothetical protein
MIRDLVRAMGGNTRILREKEFELEGFGEVAKRGAFMITKTTETRQRAKVVGSRMPRSRIAPIKRAFVGCPTVEKNLPPY